MTTDVKTLIEDRAKQHGDFAERSAIAQGIKSVIHGTSLWQGHSLKPYQRQALDEIAGKISRVLAGDPDVIDHWDDIAGYAGLVAKQLRSEAPLFSGVDPAQPGSEMTVVQTVVVRPKRDTLFKLKPGPDGWTCPTCGHRSYDGDSKHNVIYAKDSVSDPKWCNRCVDENA